MKISKKFNIYLFYFIMFFCLVFFSSSVAHATVTPSLSLSGTGDGDTVQINVSGDPTSSVLLVYVKTGAGQQIVSLGTTNVNGNLTTSVSSSNYGVASSSPVYVLVGGINGTQSQTMSWPAVASLLSSSNMLTLSQTGIVLPVGQTSTVTATNLNGSTLFLSSNSKPQIANFSISGSQISVLANGYGTTTATVCLVNNISNCGSIYVIVQNGSAQPLTFSQSSISMYSGQTVSVQISGGSGSYTVISNSSQNNALVTTSISGPVITLNTASTTGSSSITVCSVDMNSCGIINVTIGTASSVATVSFSQNNPTVTVGQTLNVSVYGPSSSLYYVSSNSNPGIVQANLSGATLTLMGITYGTSNISVCASSSNCGTLTVTVNASSGSSGGRIVFSQDVVTLNVGQNINVTVSGGTMPYTTSVTPNNIFQATLNSNILTIYGLSSGSSSISVCGNGACSSVSITVTGSGTTTSNTYVPVDCTGSLYSVSTGQACPVSTVVVSPITTYTPPTYEVTNNNTSTTTFKFTKTLKNGSTGTEVMELQKKLKALGFYTGKIDGGFGLITEKAVKAFQKAHKLSQVGIVGPQTRALLNK